jgi:inner membrane protein
MAAMNGALSSRTLRENGRARRIRGARDLPSSVGHGLAAIAAGWIVAPPAGTRRAFLMQAGTLALLGAAPDLDLLIGRHSQETHSLGAAAIVATAAAIWHWPVSPIDPSRSRIWLAAFLAWATHPLLDALSPDTLAPIGVMAFWPLSREHYITGWNVFLPISRHCCNWRMVRHDTWAMARETITLAPIVLGTWLWRRSGKSEK